MLVRNSFCLLAPYFPHLGVYNRSSALNKWKVFNLNFVSDRSRFGFKTVEPSQRRKRLRLLPTPAAVKGRHRTAMTTCFSTTTPLIHCFHQDSEWRPREHIRRHRKPRSTTTGLHLLWTPSGPPTTSSQACPPGSARRVSPGTATTILACSSITERLVSRKELQQRATTTKVTSIGSGWVVNCRSRPPLLLLDVIFRVAARSVGEMLVVTWYVSVLGKLVTNKGPTVFRSPRVPRSRTMTMRRLK